MIHLVIKEPLAYQKALCQTLSDAYGGGFVAWFASDDPVTERDRHENFAQRFLPQVGYRSFFRELKMDSQAIVIVGGWAFPFAWLTLLITNVLRVPVFIWVDHPHPRKQKARLRQVYLKLLRHRISGLLACGTPTVEHLATLGFEPGKITNFPYWVSLPEEWSVPSGCEANEPAHPIRLLTVGRLVSVKAIEVAIKALAQANETAGREIATLEVVGEGTERGRLQALVSALNAQHSVTFSGWLANDEVGRRLRKSDALIVPSSFEPYGVVVLEALANARMVLASDRVIAALDRDDQKGAILFHPVGDSARLAEQIKMLSQDRNILRSGALAARAIAERWRPERAAQILNSAFETERPALAASYEQIRTGIHP